MWVTPLIERKRDRGALRPDEWRELVLEYAAGRVPDYQMAALLMAVFLNGIEPAELAALAGAMLDTGERPGRGPPGGLRIGADPAPIRAKARHRVRDLPRSRRRRTRCSPQG